jgi:hypothetical protein
VAIAAFFCITAAANLYLKDGPTFQIKAGSSYTPGSKVQLQLYVSPGRTAPGAFRTALQYDPEIFEYVSHTNAAQTSGADIFVRQAEPLITVYTCSVKQDNAPNLSGCIVTYTFRVRSNAPAGSYTFSMKPDEACDFNGKSLPDGNETQTVVQVSAAAAGAKGSGTAVTAPRLQSLALEDSSLGQLQPSFQPEVTSYQVTVPESCKALWFCTEQPAGTAVSINRHTLKAAGSDTMITITASAAGTQAKTVYSVIVHRPHGSASSVVSSHKVSSKHQSTSASRKQSRSASGSSGEAYTPSSIPRTSGDGKASLTISGTGSFTAFQTGICVALLTACAVAAVLLAVRTRCRKRAEKDKPPETPPKDKSP